MRCEALERLELGHRLRRLGRAEGEQGLAHGRGVERHAGAVGSVEAQRLVRLGSQHDDDVAATADAEAGRLTGRAGQAVQVGLGQVEAVAGHRRLPEDGQPGPEVVSLGPTVLGQEATAHERSDDAVRRAGAEPGPLGDLAQAEVVHVSVEARDDGDGPLDRLSARPRLGALTRHEVSLPASALDRRRSTGPAPRPASARRAPPVTAGTLATLRGEQGDDLRRERGRPGRRGVQHEVGVQRGLVGVVDAGEAPQLAGARLGVEPLRVALARTPRSECRRRPRRTGVLPPRGSPGPGLGPRGTAR